MGILNIFFRHRWRTLTIVFIIFISVSLVTSPFISIELRRSTIIDKVLEEVPSHITLYLFPKDSNITQSMKIVDEALSSFEEVEDYTYITIMRDIDINLSPNKRWQITIIATPNINELVSRGLILSQGPHKQLDKEEALISISLSSHSGLKI